MNNRSIPSTHARRKIATFLENTLLLYIPLLALTDGQNHGGMNTLASRGLEEPFFQLCCCVSFLFWREIGFGCTYYYVLRVPYSCGVVLVFLVLAGGPYSQTESQMEEQIHLLRVGWWNLFSSCAVVSVFCSGGK